MRNVLVYTSARITLFIVALVPLYYLGARGLLLPALALLISALLSFVLLSRRRDQMSGALSHRLRGVSGRVSEYRTRLNEGTRAEDAEPGPATGPGQAPAGAAEPSSAATPEPQPTTADN